MYLNPFDNITHSKDQDTVIKLQLDGWVYESHCWVVMKAFKPNNKVCKWCGCKSRVDMVITDGNNTLCTGNPVLKEYNHDCPKGIMGEA